MNSDPIPMIVSPQSNEAMSTDARVDLLFDLIRRFDIQVTNTNSKAALVLAWNGIVIGTVVLRASEVLSDFAAGSAYRTIATVLLLAIASAAVVSNALAFKVVFPFLKQSSKGGSAVIAREDSLIFFGTVARLDASGYYAVWRSVGSEALLSDLCDQAVIIASGIEKKMKALQRSVIVLFVQLVLLLSLAALAILAA